MDRIYIKDFEIFANHGVFESEKSLGQKFILSLELFLDTRKAGKTDDLTKSVHYGELMEDIEKEFTKKSYDLLEKASEEICEHILLNYDLIKKVKLELKKPWAPVKKTFDCISIIKERKWSKAYIAGGANLGEKQKTLEDAIKEIKKHKDIKVIKVSNFYETSPVGYENQDDFVNCVFEIETLKTPDELMDTLLEVEKSFKRERTIKWGPRTLDLDIIFYDNLISYDQKVLIPHPRSHERQFVMKPMCDLNPYFVHPVFNKRVIDFSNELGEL